MLALLYSNMSMGALLGSIRVCSIAPCSILDGASLAIMIWLVFFYLAMMGASPRTQLNRRGSMSGHRWLFVNSDSDEALRLLKNFDRKAQNLLPRPRLDAETIGMAWGQAESRSHFTSGQVKRHSDTVAFVIVAAFVVMGWLVISISRQAYESSFKKGVLYFIIGVLAVLRIPSISVVRYPEALIHFILLPYEWLIRGARVVLYILTFPGRRILHRAAWDIICRSVLGFSNARARPVPLVKKEPDRKQLGEAFNYEELPAGPVTRALAKRRDSASRLYSPLSDKLETLESLGVLLEEANNIGKRVELVHSAYTNDIECVARIARWIAKKE